MCCLFGFHDYGHNLTRKQRSRLLTSLSIASEERGTDATGIAYNDNGSLRIYKRPLPARKMWFRAPLEATAVMGHTRMATQGSERRNQNNHPFFGRANGDVFALAHNGVLYNDKLLRKNKKLPVSKIETDSYVAVQLLEQMGELSFQSLAAMAEYLEGTFTFTVLSKRDELYFVRGNNPMCLYHFPEVGIYVYASTEEILQKGLRNADLSLGRMETVHLFSGDILRIDAKGKLSRSTFDDGGLYSSMFASWGTGRTHSAFGPYHLYENDTYIDNLKAVAPCFGLYPEDVEELLADGLTLEEIEEYLYCG